MTNRSALQSFIFVSALATAWGLQPTRAADAPQVIAHGVDAPRVPVALWEENGKRIFTRGTEVAKAPSSAAVVYAKFLELGGPNIRQVIVPAGVLVTAPNPQNDVLIYVLRGHARVTVGDQSGEVGPGDAMRELAGVRATFQAVDEVEVVESDLPADAHKKS